MDMLMLKSKLMGEQGSKAVMGACVGALVGITEG